MLEAAFQYRAGGHDAEGKRWRAIVAGACVLLLLLVLAMLGISAGSSSAASAAGAAGAAMAAGGAEAAAANSVVGGVALRGGVAHSRGGSFGNAAAVAPLSKFAFANHLVMVAGHAVLDNDHCGADLLTDAAWVLLDYQRNQGLPEAFVAHIREGVETARADPRALLVFSGGHTREASPDGEAMSYYNVAHHFNWWADGDGADATAGAGSGSSGGALARADAVGGGSGDAPLALGESVPALPVARRTFLEDFSRDSFENLLFSIARFKEVAGHYPEQVTTVSFSFKQARFEGLHRVALRWPKDAFHFIGIDPSTDRFDYARAAEGERKNAREPFETDPYGCSHAVLKSKRDGRNPYFRTAPYPLSCPELAPVLSWCSEYIFPGPLPWSQQLLL